MIRVLLADDQTLVRAGFRSLLDSQDDIEVVGEAEDGEDAVRLASELSPDVVLLDIRMPGMDGLEATRRIVRDERLDRTRIVILTTFDLDEYVFEALREGASGFLVKDTEPAELIQGVRSAARGDALLSPSVTRRVIAAIADRDGGRSEPGSERVLATVLFSDIVASTERAAEVGDRRWRDVLDRHDDLIRDALERHGGREVKTTGDGFLAMFDAPARAIRCAAAIRDALGAEGIQLRIGLHAGEVEVRGEDIGGIAVHIGSRVLGVAPPGEVVVSSTVRDLVAGSGIDFADLGEHELKGGRIDGGSMPSPPPAQDEPTVRPRTTGAPTMIRVLLADDQALVRAGFRALLDAQEDVDVVAEAGEGEEAVRLALELRPDVVLMDIRMPGMDGLAATKAIAADDRLDGVRVVILTTFGLDEYVFEAIRSGAAGFLLKDTEPAELLQAVRVVAAGEALLSPAVTRRLIEEFAARTRDAPARADLEPLTEREREVMALVGAGLSNDEIAARLFVSPATAKTHVSRAMVKLGARDRAQLVVFAYESGLVAPGRIE